MDSHWEAVDATYWMLLKSTVQHDRLHFTAKRKDGDLPKTLAAESRRWKAITTKVAMAAAGFFLVLGFAASRLWGCRLEEIQSCQAHERQRFDRMGTFQSLVDDT